MYIPSSIETKKMIEAGSKKARDDITGPGQNPTIPQPTPNKPVPKTNFLSIWKVFFGKDMWIPNNDFSFSFKK